MQTSLYPFSRGLKVGSLGGLAGSVVLGLFAALGSVAMNQEVFYVTIARKLGFADSSLIGGWALHFLVGVVAGAVFVAVTGWVKVFSLTHARKSVWVGVLGGAAVWIVVYIPVTGLLLPADLTDSTFAVGSFFLHIVYGVVTAIVSMSFLRRSVREAAVSK
jgi:hypothetical protein